MAIKANRTIPADTFPNTIESIASTSPEGALQAARAYQSAVCRNIRAQLDALESREGVRIHQESVESFHQFGPIVAGWIKSKLAKPETILMWAGIVAMLALAAKLL